MPPATYSVLTVVAAQMGYGDGLEMFFGVPPQHMLFFPVVGGQMSASDGRSGRRRHDRLF